MVVAILTPAVSTELAGTAAAGEVATYFSQSDEGGQSTSSERLSIPILLLATTWHSLRSAFLRLSPLTLTVNTCQLTVRHRRPS